MNETGRELVEKIHREALERYREQERKGREAFEAVFRAAFEHHRRNPTPPAEPPTIHYTELPNSEPNSPICQEWNHYRREVPRLLAEGQEGRFLLIKGEEIIGIWDTQEEAKAVALQKYLMQPCLIHQILTREPILRGPTRFWRCPS
jgi:hypothetical protein